MDSDLKKIFWDDRVHGGVLPPALTLPNTVLGGSGSQPLGGDNGQQLGGGNGQPLGGFPSLIATAM